ncbi:MAG: hypothetical protein K2Z81_20350, partial [Cyanobacteria bacterium]|nr:hypothetical protein [Cyanobacteriota bacterium]
PGLGSGNQQPDNGTSAADWTVEAESTLDPKEFEHECFEIRSIVTSDVRIYKTGNDCAKNAYEKLWYHDGHALGMRKQGILSIPADSKVAIRIVEPTCSSGEETKASANIVMRLVLDVLLNKDTITSVTVPSASYQTVLRDLQSRGVKVMPPGEEAPESAKVKFNLQSQSTGMKQAVYFM